MMDNNRKTLNKREILMGHAYVFLFFFLTTVACCLAIFMWNSDFRMFEQKEFVKIKMNRIKDFQQEQAEVGQHHGDAEHHRSPGEHHHIGQQPNQDFGPWVQKGTAGSRRPHCASPAFTKCLRMSFMPSRAPRMEPTRILRTMTPNTGQVNRPSMVAI